MKTRITAFALSMLMLIGILASCAGGTEEEVTTPAVTTEAPVVTTEPVTTEYVETLDVPDDYFCNGYEFTILCTSWMNNPPTPFAYKDTELVLDEAIYRRNTTVEDKYGIMIETVEDYTTAGNSGIRRLQANRTAGDTLYDAGLIAVFDTSKLAYQGYLSDLQETPYVDLTKSWWDQNATHDITIFGKTFYTAGDISFLDREYTFATFFNKSIAKEKGLGDLYEIVRNGKWTVDAMSEMCKKVSEDLNGDDVIDSRDEYGLIMWDDTLITMINAAGESLATLEDDVLTLTANSPVAVEMVDKYFELCNDQSVYNFQHGAGGVGWVEMYTNGQALFLIEYLKALTTFRDTDLEYGILPMPKLNEQQERYYCGLAGYQAGMYCIPVDVYDEELSGIITEALAYHSQKIVTPAYYDRTLIGRHVQDAESEETLKIIFDSRIYDLGLFYKVGTLNTRLNSMMASKNNQYASTVEKVRALIDKDLRNINEFFSGNN
ncbi:MAG: extracellular solute-binding protein [Clostridia bacterium]|nr:extracellular solute-binding protein [Clostridia bacterium]